MLSMHSQLLSSSNSKILTLGVKWSKMLNFSSIGQSSELSLKLTPTCQHESKGMLRFQNKVPDVKI